ncbi:MAG: hypothetical protein FJ134_16790, partial [Deltaproteobacteria bacterium]|nr:hypothetical protein [Deltaproteobacteria bacterium]
MLILFAISLFASALLLFLVQPMFSKMVLPRLGGTPAVWITCMVFYQAVLLAGYVYAHLSTRWLGVRWQAVAHLALLLAVFLTLPIAAAQGWVPPPTANPTPWLLMLLLVSVGLPFFVISITAPMLQKWFAHTGHPAAQDPYFLYAASNLGSMAALLGYPVLVEPFLSLAQQAWVWSLSYGLLALLIVVCGLVLWLSPESRMEKTGEAAAAVSNPGDHTGAASPLTVNQRLWWIMWSFAPSSLLLGITTYITTDIAAVPLLWIIPLALYLLTFVIVFSRRPLISHRLMVAVQPAAMLLVAILFLWGLQAEGVWVIFLHLLAFFVTAMVCHGELARSRPPTLHLTEYYLWIAVGGVLGGIFNAIVAPLIFKSLAEYPLVLVLACLLRPQVNEVSSSPKARWLDFILPLILAAVLAAVVYDQESGSASGKITTSTLIISCAAVMAGFAFARRPVRFGLGIGAIMLAGVLYSGGQYKVLHAERSFFGVIQVLADSGGHYHMFYHGTTLHGAQSTDPERRREPLTYYLPTGPIGQIFDAFWASAAPRTVAIVGLGAGSLSCYAAPGDRWDFYEIDPAVERIARNPQYFTYLRDCKAHKRVILGDARLSLIQAPNQRYGLIIFDAFSSDAVPIHLVNREALRLYLDKLADGGILVFHISNRYLDLKPVLGNLAQDAGLVALIQNRELTEDEENAFYVRTTYVVMARKAEDLGFLMHKEEWEALSGQPGARLWTN